MDDATHMPKRESDGRHEHEWHFGGWTAKSDVIRHITVHCRFCDATAMTPVTAEDIARLSYERIVADMERAANELGGVPESGCNGEARSERPDNQEAGVAPGPVGSNPTPSATCPGCDGTITRAIQQGREITTFERCQRCREREDRVAERFRDSIVTRPPVWRSGEGVWWRPGVGGPGRHPGCTCPMTGEKPAWHHDDCAAHDDDAREI